MDDISGAEIPAARVQIDRQTIRFLRRSTD
jgi:hypothetical protein